MKKLLLPLLLALLASPSVKAASDPENLFTKVYKMYVSENADCSDPVLVMDAETVLGEALIPMDMLLGPTLGSGEIADGTYECIVLKMSDQMSFTASATDGACTAGETYDLDVCMDYGVESEAAFTTNPVTGVETQCADAEGTDDTIYVYVSTNSTGEGGGESSNPLQPPTSEGDAAHGIMLTSPLVVDGDAEVTFVIDGTGKVESNFGNCDMQPPTFGFR